MKLLIFSVHDSKAEAFIQPFFVPTRAQAVRSFQRAVNDTTTDFHHFPGDYTLFEIGAFESDSGEIFTHATPVNLGLAIIHVKPSETAQLELLGPRPSIDDPTALMDFERTEKSS